MKNLYILLAILIQAFSAKAQVFDVSTYGAVGDGSTVNTIAIQAAIDSCHNAGGGIVEVPAGNFVTGTLFLKSNVTFHISQGGTVTGSTNLADYPDVHPLKRTYTDNYSQKSVFYAEGQSNIAVTGEGTFNGNGQSVTFLLNQNNRPFGFRFISCTNVRYEGLNLRHSAFWMMHNFDIDTLVIKNLNIINQAYGNNDGIDIDGCRHVLVDSCFADCNDDPMVIKTTSPIGSSDIEIKNCTVATYSRALKIGTETNGPINNVHIHDCTVQLSTNGPFGSSTPAGSGINLSIVDGGSMENVLVENISMSGINTPLFVRLGNRARKYTDTAAMQPVGFVRNIEIRNVTATASSNISSSITGIPNYPVHNVWLRDVDVTYPGGWSQVSSGFAVPENETGKPDANMFGDTLPAAGLYLRHLDSVRLERVCFHPQQPDGRPTIVSDDVAHFDSSNVCNGSSIAANSLFKSLRLFPNPVNDVLHIDIPSSASSTEVTVYNTLGRLLLNAEIKKDNTLDVHQFSSGLYFVRFVNGDNAATRPFIKQ